MIEARVQGREGADRLAASAPSSTRLTTGKVIGGLLYLVDSKFDEAVGTPPYEVVVLKLH